MCYKFLIFHIFHFFIFLSLVCAEPAIKLNQTTVLNQIALGINQERTESATDCHELCGCDRAYIYNATSNQCDLNMDYIVNTALIQMSEGESGYKNEDHDIMNDDGMAKRIRLEAQKVFKGIIISVIIFMAFASLCTVSACIYCCHINYSDRKLKSDVKALAKKLKQHYNSKKGVRRTPLEPIEESCNVIVGNAGLYVV